jgi:hypothetical protein
VEFRDDLFQSFVDGPADKVGYFHVMVREPSPEQVAPLENKNFTPYLLQAPLADDARMAFVKNGSEAATTLHDQTAGGMSYHPVLEVVKRKTPDKQDYFEILSVQADDWFPR